MQQTIGRLDAFLDKQGEPTEYGYSPRRQSRKDSDRGDSPAPPLLMVQNSPGVLSLSLYDIPSWVPPSILNTIMAHEFRAVDLHKLDPKHREKKQRRTLAVSGDSIEIQPSISDYISLSSIAVPLATYFNILVRALATSYTNSRKLGQVFSGFMRYQQRLLELSSDYEWTAVREYHSQFFDSRVAEMAQGEYDMWSNIDMQLQASCLFGRLLTKPARSFGTNTSQAAAPSGTKTFKKRDLSPQSRDINAKTMCFKFQAGCCDTPCRFGHIHQCAQCSSTDHGAVKHDTRWTSA
ncbi:hypothetical protein OF83DRAFT_1073129 [Amylostereum chailletii]|nr:hypothetical protein OF83DRAFT_1073129 [Amylostereum chailletii]